MSYSSYSFAGVNDELKFVRASNAQGTLWNAPITIDTAGGRDTSLAIVDGRPAISYHDDKAGNLKYAHADDPQGTSWKVIIIDAVGDVGAHTSLAPC